MIEICVAYLNRNGCVKDAATTGGGSTKKTGSRGKAKRTEIDKQSEE